MCYIATKYGAGLEEVVTPVTFILVCCELLGMFQKVVVRVCIINVCGVPL